MISLSSVWKARTAGRSGVRQEEPLDVVAVRLEQHGGAAQVADLLVGPLDHPVPLAGLGVEHLAGARDFEALLGARLGLQLGHLALTGLCPALAGRPTSVRGRAERPPRQPWQAGRSTQGAPCSRAPSRRQPFSPPARAAVDAGGRLPLWTGLRGAPASPSAVAARISRRRSSGTQEWRIPPRPRRPSASSHAARR